MVNHTWSDVAYGFFVGSSGDISPACLVFIVGALVYFGIKTLR